MPLFDSHSVKERFQRSRCSCKAVTLAAVCCVLLLFVPLPQLVSADDKAPNPIRKLLDDSLGEDELFTGDSPGRVTKPVVAMRWANNSRGSELGMTVFFIDQGAPAAVCCVYPWDQFLIHEYDLLGRRTLYGQHAKRVFWRPAENGPSFARVPGAPEPAAMRTLLLRQMKNLAAEFSSTMLG